MSIAEFEVMRAATDRRNTVWAAALAAHVRRPDANIRMEVRDAIINAIAIGDLELAQSNWGSDNPKPLPKELAEAALAEEVQWHPRRLPWARRLRLVATRQGADKFWAGEFGRPSPIDVSISHASDYLELQAITCAEATGMALGVVGFMAGSTLGFLLVTGSLPFIVSDWRAPSVLAWVVGGGIGLTSTLWAWNKRFPSVNPDDLPSTVLPDYFNQGPDLSGRDAFGDPRF
ncbi:MAG: hypothetical protein ABIV13_03370 [Fimbriimonadales bacterium]